jgi:hypothetical protein
VPSGQPSLNEAVAARPISQYSREAYIAQGGDQGAGVTDPMPQTIGHSLLDSAIGRAAWMLDHDADRYEKIPERFWRASLSGTSARTASSTTSRRTG